MKKLRLKNNNIGMTLVELLVAIAIFAAAIVPMLYAFVYSTGFNFKAQQTMQSTGIAQAIIEKCKAANVDYDELVADLTSGDILTENNNFDFDTASFTTNALTGESYYLITGVKAKTFEGHDVSDAVDGGNSNRRSYNVKVTLTPMTDAITDYSALHPMRSGITANYVSVDSLRGQDSAFQVAFMEELKETVRDNAVITPTVPSDAVRNTLTDYIVNSLDIQKLELKRVITIDADDSGVKVTVDYEFVSYNGLTSLQYDNHHANGGTNYHVTLNATPDTHLDSSKSYYLPPYEDDILTTGPASSVFFYYYPLYKATAGFDGTNGTIDDTAGFTDSFILNNNMTHDYLGTTDGRLDFYLFKQLPLSGTDDFYPDADIEGLDDEYKAEIRLNGNGVFVTNLYHNLLWNVSSLDDIDTAYYPVVTETAGSLAYNRTYVVHADPSNLTDRSSLRPHVTQNYKDTFYVTTVTGYEHDSYILEDMACIPYGSEKSDIALAGRFGSRFKITVEVINPSTGSTIETMTSEFLNW